MGLLSGASSEASESSMSVKSPNKHSGYSEGWSMPCFSGEKAVSSFATSPSEASEQSMSVKSPYRHSGYAESSSSWYSKSALSICWLRSNVDGANRRSAILMHPCPPSAPLVAIGWSWEAEARLKYKPGFR